MTNNQKSTSRVGWVATRVRSVLAIAALVLGTTMPVVGLTPRPAAAYQSGRLYLAWQTAYVSSDGTFEMLLTWTGPEDPDLELLVSVHDRIRQESQVGDAADGILVRAPAVPLSSLPRTSAGHLSFKLPIRSFSPGNQDRIWIPTEGVYPVSVELRSPEGPLNSLQTHLIRLPTETAELDPLDLSMLLRVSSADGLTLDEVIPLLSKHESLPVTVLLGSGVLPQLANTPDQTEALRDALNGRPVLAMPRLDLDPSALADIGQGPLYHEAIAQTRRELTGYGLVSAVGTFPIDSPLTGGGAELLLDDGIVRVTDVGVVPLRGGFIETSAGRLQVLEIDDTLSVELQHDARDVEHAHRLLARLALRFEADNTSVVLGGSALSNASNEALDIVLSALSQPGLLEAVPLAEADIIGIPIRPRETPAQDLRSIQPEIEDAQELIDTYEGFHEAGGPPPQVLRGALLAALSRNLNPENRRQAVEQVHLSVESELDTISLPQSQSVTIASQNPMIPMAIDNGATGARTVLLRFRSDKIDVAQQDQTVTIGPGAEVLHLDVEARSIGVSPLDVLVLTPDGNHELASTRFQVRSTAVPGLGLLLSGIAFFFLALWWARSIRQTRRDRAATSGGPT